MDTPIAPNIDRNREGKLKKVRYGLGWNVRELGGGRYNAWHNGSLAGTSSILVRRSDDKCWAVLFNTRDNPTGEFLPSIIDPLIHRAVDTVKQWPDVDLFRKWL